MLLVALVLAALMVGLGAAFRTPAPAPRRAIAQLVGWNMALGMDPAPHLRLVRMRSDRSRARRGTPGGYRGAEIFIDPGASCDPKRDPVDCGAKLEVYRTLEDADRRAALLAAEGERVRVQGEYHLRGSAHLSAERWRAYGDAFLDALGRLPSLSQIATTGRSASAGSVLSPAR